MLPLSGHHPRDEHACPQKREGQEEEEEEEEGEVDQEEDGCTTDTTQTISIDSAITVQTFDDLLVQKMETNLLS